MNWYKLNIRDKVNQLRKENDMLLRQNEFLLLVVSVLKEKGIYSNDELKNFMVTIEEAKEKLRQEHYDETRGQISSKI